MSLRLAGIWLCYAVVCFVPARAYTAPVDLETTSVRVVGPRANVLSLAEDSGHFLWMAGDQGLCRFDGLTVECPVSQPTTWVVADPHGGVWFTTEQGVVGRIAAVGSRAKYLQTGPPATSVAVDGHGHVWVGTAKGLYAVNRDQVLAERPTFDQAVTMLLLDAKGDLIAASANRLYRLTGAKVALLWQGEDTIHSAVVKASDVVVALNNASVLRVSTRDTGGHAQRLSVPPYPTLGPMAGDAEGRLWIGDRDGLLVLASNEAKTTAFPLQLNVSAFRLNALAFDHEGNLWVGSETGLIQVRFDQPIRPLSFSGSPARPAMVFSLSSADNGDLWMATLPGVSRWNGGLTEFDSKSGLIYPDVRSVATASGEVWAAGMESGVFRWAVYKFVSVVDSESKRSPGASVLRPRHAGGVWVGLWQGGLGAVQDNVFRLLIPPSGTLRDRVRDLYERPDGSLLIATAGDGLMIWQNEHVSKYGTEVGLPKAEIFSMYAQDDGIVWLGSDGAGLFRFDGHRAQSVSTTHGLDDAQVFSIIGDDHKNLWLGTPHGLSLVSIPAIEAVLAGKQITFSSASFGPDDGVVAEPMRSFPPSAIRRTDGTLLFATTQGVLQVKPEALRSTQAPNVVLTSITLDGRRLEPTTHVVATTPNTTDLTVAFSAPTFTAPHRLKFRYQLSGMDSHFTSIHSGHVNVDRLPHGHYQLIVEAFHSGTDTGPPGRAVLDIVLNPPWHQRLVIRATGVALFLLACAYVWQARRRRLEESGAVVAAERARIAHEIHDGLEQDLSGLRLQVHAARQAVVASPERALANLDRASALIGDASVDLRMAIWKLQLDATNSAGLLAALDQRLQRATAGTSVALKTEAVGPSRALPVGVATHLAAVAREAVANALKHASASEISLVIDTSNPREISLLVQDDGNGGYLTSDTMPREGAGGLGLAGMKARARALNGSFSVSARESGGTRIHLRAPLRGKR